MIYIVLEGLPPSSNTAYINLPPRKKEGSKGFDRGGRVLSPEGKKYKKDVINFLVKNHGPELKQLKKDATIGCLIAYGFSEMLSKGWPDKAQNRFRKNDLMNRPKLLQDAIAEATSMDDSQICFDFKYKYQTDVERTTIYIWNEDDEPIGNQLFAAFSSIIGSAR